MNSETLARLAHDCRCRVFGVEAAGNSPQREVLAALIRGFDHPDAAVLCEPGLARRSTRPPDAVLVDVQAGVHVVEVKAVTLDQVEAIEPGGLLRVRYASGLDTKSPIAQARMAMFDIKNAAEQAYPGDLTLPFRYWAVMASIHREAWLDRWGRDAYAPPELLFADDLPRLAERLREVGQRQLDHQGLRAWPGEQLSCVWRAFGDSSVLYHPPEEREARRVPEATLGERFDEAAESYRTLSDEQQRLSAQDWSGGPRLVRGVAGSGKTIVLANNLARRLRRALGEGGSLFEEMERRPRLLAVCYNRTLVPFLRQKIEVAYRQRTGHPLPDDAVEVWHYNRLLWHLSCKGLWRYQKIEETDDEGRVGQYLTELEHVRRHEPDLLDAVAYDAIYIDEGQDFHEEDFRLLKDLCKTEPEGEPDLYIFYDDAQNFLGRRRPNWKSLGLNLVGGRSHIMTQCFRNTRPIVEASFNVLYGRFAGEGAEVPTRDFGDVATLEEKGLIEDKGDHFQVRFAVRDGMAPRLTLALDAREERGLLVDRLKWLVDEQRVRPEDVLVLAPTWRRVEELAGSIRRAELTSVAEMHNARDDQDRILRRRGCLPLSTVASSKGYDAYCVLLASADEFPADVTGRASFYVGCTRAIEYLEVFARERKGLVPEVERAFAKAGPSAVEPQ